MFLFSTPARQEPPRPESVRAGDHPIAQPLRAASEATGIPFDYLVKTAKRESNLNPEAKAANSSATGLFQFIEQTWLGLVKRQGPQLGLSQAASAIQQDRSGRYVVAEADMRQQILALRKDPTLSARLAGIFTSENKASLREALGRDPSGGELYIAHFMGAGGARELITQAAGNPERAAASAFPDAASSNRTIFFDPKGRARTMREVYARLVSFHDGADSTVAPMMAVAAPQGDNGPPTRSPLAIAPARNVTQTGQLRRDAGFYGFFRSGGDTPAANTLRQNWQQVADSRMPGKAPSFFPRGDGVKVASLDDEAARIQAALDRQDAEQLRVSPLTPFEAKIAYEEVIAPLPPVRPANLPGADNGLPLDLTRPAGAKR
ncbi:MAG: transglycosylase SLT domain-containing protein [Proteobacteria bacterium]|nr:transglycosylase SLT domain-containing protein [Pseudomonadota bacterium]